MDLATVIGLLAAFGLMVTAIMQGSSLLVFFDIAAITIVIGGTIGTTLVHFPFSDVMGAFRVARHAFFHKPLSPTDTIEKLITYAGKARKEGILSLQSVMNEIDDDFFLQHLLQCFRLLTVDRHLQPFKKKLIVNLVHHRLQ